MFVWSNIEHTASTAYCHAVNGALSSVKLLTRPTVSPVIKKTPCTSGLTLFYFTDARAHANCVQKHASLVRICGSYLWPASLPKEPMVRRELEGFIHMGSGVFCTSVLTSGSISEADGVSFAPAMALRLRGCCFQRGSQSFFFLLESEQTGSFTDRQRRRKTHLPSHWWCAEAEGARLLPCRITGVVRHTETEHRFVVSRTPPSLIEKSWIGASEIRASSRLHINLSANRIYNEIIQSWLNLWLLALSIRKLFRENSEKPTSLRQFLSEFVSNHFKQKLIPTL